MTTNDGAASLVRSDALFAPCPFCGRRVGYISSHDGYRVACDPCDIYGPRGVDYHDAKAKWNQMTMNDQTTKTDGGSGVRSGALLAKSGDTMSGLDGLGHPDGNDWWAVHNKANRHVCNVYCQGKRKALKVARSQGLKSAHYAYYLGPNGYAASLRSAGFKVELHAANDKVEFQEGNKAE